MWRPTFRATSMLLIVCVHVATVWQNIPLELARSSHHQCTRSDGTSAHTWNLVRSTGFHRSYRTRQCSPHPAAATFSMFHLLRGGGCTCTAQNKSAPDHKRHRAHADGICFWNIQVPAWGREEPAAGDPARSRIQETRIGQAGGKAAHDRGSHRAGHYAALEGGGAPGRRRPGKAPCRTLRWPGQYY